MEGRLQALFVLNSPTTYQIDFCRELSKRIQVQFLFLGTQEMFRNWSKLELPNVSFSQSKVESELPLDEILAFNANLVVVGGYKYRRTRELRKALQTRGKKLALWLERPLPRSSLKGVLRSLAQYWIFRSIHPSFLFTIGEQSQKYYSRFCGWTENLPYSIAPGRYTRISEETSIPGPHFVFLGQLIHRKGILELLSSFAEIKKTSATLTIIGSGEHQSKVEEAAIRDKRIRYLGFLNADSIGRELAKADVLVAPSRHDGWGVMVIEAMAANLAVISTRETAAFCEYVGEEGGTFCTVDRDSIAAAIRRYCDNPGLAKKQGNRNLKVFSRSRINAEVAAEFVTGLIQKNGNASRSSL